MFNFLNDNSEYKELRLALDKKSRSISVHNICDNAKVFLVSTFDKMQKLVVLSSEEEALSFFDAYKYYDDNVYYYTERDLLFEKNDKDNETIDKNRINILTRLSNKENITVIATISSLLEKIPKMDMLLQNTININTNDNINIFLNESAEEKNIDEKESEEIEEKKEILIDASDFSLFDKFI
ncbi:MAG: hypothetical protein MJ151_03040, partial [Lachnospiraceae bacterium]|nr:hypothetical protein [Lachnospiraceae bacterium]